MPTKSNEAELINKPDNEYDMDCPDNTLNEDDKVGNAFFYICTQPICYLQILQNCQTTFMLHSLWVENTKQNVKQVSNNKC